MHGLSQPETIYNQGAGDQNPVRPDGPVDLMPGMVCRLSKPLPDQLASWHSGSVANDVWFVSFFFSIRVVH
jgi:hypothetical protein